MALEVNSISFSVNYFVNGTYFGESCGIWTDVRWFLWFSDSLLFGDECTVGEQYRPSSRCWCRLISQHRNESEKRQELSHRILDNTVYTSVCLVLQDNSV
jgi:hypothetical protein